MQLCGIVNEQTLNKILRRAGITHLGLVRMKLFGTVDSNGMFEINYEKTIDPRQHAGVIKLMDAGDGDPLPQGVTIHKKINLPVRRLKEGKRRKDVVLKFWLYANSTKHLHSSQPTIKKGRFLKYTNEPARRPFAAI